jgi:hypothetical protein
MKDTIVVKTPNSDNDYMPHVSWRSLRNGLKISIVGLAIVGLFFTLDGFLGLFYSTNTSGRVIVTPSHSRTTKQAIVVFPGYVMSGQVLTKAFEPYLSHDDAMVTVQYAQRGVDVNALYQLIMSQLRHLAPHRLRIYGASMGGLCAKAFLDRYVRDGSPFGQPILILDTAPSGANTIKRPTLLFDLASWYRGGPLTSALWAAVSSRQTGPIPEENANRILIEESQHAYEWVGMPALTSQAAFVAEFPQPKANDVARSSIRVVYIHGSNPQDDPLVRIDRAIDDWQTAFPAMTISVIQSRSGRWHIPLVERPRETMKALLDA